MQDGLQKFSEAAKVSVFMGVKQPANFGDKRGLDGTGLDIMAEILQIRPEAFVEVLLGGVVGHQNTDIHLVCDALRAKTLKVLADGSIGLPKFVRFIQHFFVEGCRGFVNKVNVRVAHVFKFCKALCLFCDHAA